MEPVRGLRGGEEEGGVRSGPGAARTILILHIISASPSKQPLLVGSTLGVYSVRLIFVSARTNKRHHHHLGKVAHRLLNAIACCAFVSWWQNVAEIGKRQVLINWLLYSNNNIECNIVILYSKLERIPLRQQG